MCMYAYPCDRAVGGREPHEATTGEAGVLSLKRREEHLIGLLGHHAQRLRSQLGAGAGAGLGS